MIKVIGFQRVLLLMVLAGLLALFFAYSTYGLTPEIKQTERQLRVNRKEVGELTEDVNKLVEGMKTYESQKGTFEVLQNKGFFDPQNRLETRQRIKEMREESRLLSVGIDIGSAVEEQNELAKEAGLKVLNTDISFTLDALEDIDIYNFIYLMNYGFPGQVIINTLSIKKQQDITQPLLRKLGSGDHETLVKANLTANWRTLVPDASIQIDNNQVERGN